MAETSRSRGDGDRVQADEATGRATDEVVNMWIITLGNEICLQAKSVSVSGYTKHLVFDRYVSIATIAHQTAGFPFVSLSLSFSLEYTTRSSR